jgi:hypothetical protein
MARQSRKLAVFAVAAAFVLPATAAHAQFYGAAPPPLYPYTMQNSGVPYPSGNADQPYAVEVAPGTYMIQRNAPARGYPYVRSQPSRRGIVSQAVEPSPGKFDRPHKPVDHALVEELRQRQQTKDAAVSATKIVRDPPVVVEHQRTVDDQPRVIERRHADDEQAGTVEQEKPAARDDNKKRVIAADAEVTILGPDRMSIRLFRKGQGPKANARAD